MSSSSSTEIRSSSSSSMQGCEPDYCATAFTTSNINGTYSWMGFYYNGKAVYNNGTYSLWYELGIWNRWAISVNVGSAPASWMSYKITINACPDGTYQTEAGVIAVGECSTSSSSSSTEIRSSSSSSSSSSTEIRSSSSSSSTKIRSSSSSSTEIRSSSSTEWMSSSSSSSTEWMSSSSDSTEVRSSFSSWSSSSTSSSTSTSNPSSLSSFSFLSSSSSSDQIFSRPITLPLINQNHGDLIPFSWVAEGGASVSNTVSTVLGFTIEAVDSSYFNYSAIINRDNSAVTSLPTVTEEPTIYVPNSDESKYKHEKSFYVDVIAKDGSGIKEVRTHVDPKGYDFEKAEDAGQVFVIPKFTWK